MEQKARAVERYSFFASTVTRIFLGAVFLVGLFAFEPLHARAVTMSPLSGACNALNITVTQDDISDNSLVFVGASDKNLIAQNGVE